LKLLSVYSHQILGLHPSELVAEAGCLELIVEPTMMNSQVVIRRAIAYFKFKAVDSAVKAFHNSFIDSLAS